MAGIDDILNVIIPIGAIAFFGFTMFKALGPELKRFWEWIGEMFQDRETKAEPQIDPMHFEGGIKYNQ